MHRFSSGCINRGMFFLLIGEGEMKMNLKGLLAVSVIAPSTLLASPYLVASSMPNYGTASSTASQPPAKTGQTNQKTASAVSPTKPKGSVESLPPPSRVTLNLVEALNAGNLVMARMLLQNGADINCRNCTSNGQTPLIATYKPVGKGEPNTKLEWLLANGADPNIPDHSGRTSLMYMANHMITNIFFSGIEDFEYLLSKGADVKVKDNEGNTVLHYLSMEALGDADSMARGGWGGAAYSKAKQWMRAFEGLMAKGADINAANKGGDTPLMYVAAKCNPHLVETFLRYGADPTAKNKIGQSPLQIAIDKASRNASQVCNRVVEILQSAKLPSVAQPVTSPPKVSGTLADNGSFSEWTGVFRAIKPARGEAKVSVRLEPSGALTFKSSSGLQGSGMISSQEGQVTASVKAISPKDATGKPIFGANEIIFDMTGQNENGVIRGEYKSIVESGTFILCSPEARRNGSQCDAPPSLNPFEALLDSLRTLTGR